MTRQVWVTCASPLSEAIAVYAMCGRRWRES